jgi:predicted transposase/invertase (TIGR01784 family)
MKTEHFALNIWIYLDVSSCGDTLEEAVAKEEGLEKGREEGRIEGKLETAKNFLLMGMDVEIVAKGTKLPVEQIRKLQKSLLN